MLKRSIVALIALAMPQAAQAQRISWDNRFTLYGDNTEFFNRYREGETILGGQVSSVARFSVSDRAVILAGVFGDVRWGSADFLDDVKPVLSFRYLTRTSTGVFGTLVTERRHGFLDPLAVSTLELTRPIEYGAQWIERRRQWDIDVYINWQALNTPTQREVFDYGWVVNVRPVRYVTVAMQLHGLHHGGQLFDAGVPVTNNTASAFGVEVADSLGWLGRSSIRAYRLRSSGNIDPSAPPGRPTRGRGTFLQATVSPASAVEAFGIYWRGRDFLAQEGDPNYGSVGLSPSFYRSRRAYAEVGVIRRTRLDEAVALDAELRFHRVDDQQGRAFFGTRWEYSYRLVVRAGFDVLLRDRR